MARTRGGYLIQNNGGVVDITSPDDELLVSFDPSDANAVAIAQGTIHHLENVEPEDKSFMHFWSGYFYAHGNR